MERTGADDESVMATTGAAAIDDEEGVASGMRS